MYGNTDMWMRAFADMQRLLAHQSERIDELERRLSELGGELRRIGERPPTHIEKIEYHFEQLKIERLDGSLTIGLAPFSSGTIDQLSTDGQAAEDVPIPPEGAGGPGGDPAVTVPREARLVEEAKRAVDEYLRTEARADLARLEEREGLYLGEETRGRIIVDVEGQATDRIRVYVRRLLAQDGTHPDEEVAREAAARTIRDIRTAFDQYIKTIPHNGSDAR